jgi:hypothetical protein
MARSRYEDSVFINCPFDSSYAPLFRAIVFAVVDSGFDPRCALEDADSAVPRIEKICNVISHCRYGIHDISATELDPVNGLPRFNMPLELGLFLGAQRFGAEVQHGKRCIVLDREKYRYQKFCSDIAGQDVKTHDGTPRGVIRCVRDWLKAERPRILLPGGSQMFRRYEEFLQDLPLICDSVGLEPAQLTFHDLLNCMAEWFMAPSIGNEDGDAVGQ